MTTVSDDDETNKRPLAALVREARGLTANEKLFLLTVASHRKTMRKSAQECAADMALGRSTFFRVGNALMDKKLLITFQHGGRNSVVRYEINIPVLEAYASGSQGRFHVPERDSTVSERDSTVPERDSSSPGAGHEGEQKGKEKGNEKGVVVSLHNRKASS